MPLCLCSPCRWPQTSFCWLSLPRNPCTTSRLEVRASGRCSRSGPPADSLRSTSRYHRLDTRSSTRPMTAGRRHPRRPQRHPGRCPRRTRLPSPLPFLGTLQHLSSTPHLPRCCRHFHYPSLHRLASWDDLCRAWHCVSAVQLELVSSQSSCPRHLISFACGRQREHLFD